MIKQRDIYRLSLFRITTSKKILNGLERGENRKKKDHGYILKL